MFTYEFEHRVHGLIRAIIMLIIFESFPEKRLKILTFAFEHLSQRSIEVTINQSENRFQKIMTGLVENTHHS